MASTTGSTRPNRRGAAGARGIEAAALLFFDEQGEGRADFFGELPIQAVAVRGFEGEQSVFSWLWEHWG